MPQFKNDRLDKMFEQTGEFDDSTLKFIPEKNFPGGYMVQFDCVEEFEKYRTDNKKKK